MNPNCELVTPSSTDQTLTRKKPMPKTTKTTKPKVAAKKKTPKKAAAKKTVAKSTSKAKGKAKPETTKAVAQVDSTLTTSEQKPTSRKAQFYAMLDRFHFELPKGYGKPTKKGGRPSVIDDLVLRKLEYAFAIGSTIEGACIFSGIYPSTYYDFVKKFPKFSETVALLQNNPVMVARQTIFESLFDDPASSRWFLERKKKDEFSAKIELGGEMKHTHSVTEEEETAIDNVFTMFETQARESEPKYVVYDEEDVVDVEVKS